MNIRRCVFLVGLLGAAASAGAHHSFVASYDPSLAAEMTGIVVEYTLKSPHSLTLLDVTGEDGTVERYEVELAVSTDPSSWGGVKSRYR